MIDEATHQDIKKASEEEKVKDLESKKEETVVEEPKISEDSDKAK